MKLTDVLKCGQDLDTESESRATVMTPLGAGQFVKLVEAKASEMNPRKTWGLQLVFNTTPNEETNVDLSKVFLPAIMRVAKANDGLIRPPTSGADGAAYTHLEKTWGKALGYCIWRGWLRAGDEDSKRNDDGTWKNGFGPGRVSVSLNRYADSEEGNRPMTLDGAGKPCDPRKIKSGNLVRCTASIYWSKAGKRVCFGLEAAQYIAKGDPYQSSGGGPRVDVEKWMTAVEGAEPLEEEAPSDMFDDDLPF